MTERVLVVDWIAGGHHEQYVVHAARALAPVAEVVVAVPEVSRSRVAGPWAVHSLGDPRPAAGEAGQPSAREVADREVAAIRDAIAATRATRVLHMFGDDLVESLADAPPMGAPVALMVFRAILHYPRRFRSFVMPADLLAAARWQRSLARWRRRPDAGPVLFFDEVAARLASRRRGAPALWQPEAPVPEAPGPSSGREGIVLAGALAARKGIDRLAAAITLRPTTLRVTLAGRPAEGFEPELARHSDAMRAAGAHVALLDRWLAEDEYLATLAGARVVAIPYPFHRGMSRLLLESAAARTPVVADRFGLLGWLTRTHGLGVAVDTADPEDFRAALDALTAAPPDPAQAARLERFAARYTQAGFDAAIRAVIA